MGSRRGSPRRARAAARSICAPARAVSRSCSRSPFRARASTRRISRATRSRSRGATSRDYGLGQRVELVASDLYSALRGAALRSHRLQSAVRDATRSMRALPAEYRQRARARARRRTRRSRSRAHASSREAPAHLNAGGLLVVEVGHNRDARRARLSRTCRSCGRRRAAATTACSLITREALLARVLRAARLRRVLLEPREQLLHLGGGQRAHLPALQPRRQRDDAEAHAHQAAHGKPERFEHAAARRGCGLRAARCDTSDWCPRRLRPRPTRTAPGRRRARCRSSGARSAPGSAAPTMRTAYSRSTAKRGCIMRFASSPDVVKMSSPEVLKSSRPTASHFAPRSGGSCSNTLARPSGSSCETISPSGL